MTGAYEQGLKAKRQEELDAFWARKRRECMPSGEPWAPVLNDDFRRVAERVYVRRGFSLDPEELEDLEEGVETFKRLLLPVFEAVQALAYFRGRPTQRLVAPKKRYARPFEKRLHLVDFVIGMQLRLQDLLGPSYRRPRIDWEQVRGAWNEAHPHDLMTPAVLKRTFYRAVGEAEIRKEFLGRKQAALTEHLALLASQPVSDIGAVLLKAVWKDVLSKLARALPGVEGVDPLVGAAWLDFLFGLPWATQAEKFAKVSADFARLQWGDLVLLGDEVDDGNK